MHAEVDLHPTQKAQFHSTPIVYPFPVAPRLDKVGLYLALQLGWQSGDAGM
jgi:hypothetical protein